jgi:hypothetical protein
MGNESSTIIDEDTPPQTLEHRNLESIAKYILEKNVRRIVVMVRTFSLNYLHAPSQRVYSSREPVKKTNSFLRLVQASARQQEFQILDRLKQAYNCTLIHQITL